MSERFVIINFKHYENATGPGSSKLLQQLASSSIPDGTRVMCAMNIPDIIANRSKGSFQLISQHVDEIGYGPYTGKLSMEYLLDQGITTSLLNHSEYRVQPEKIEKTIEKSNSAGFDIVLCVENEREAERYAKLNPAFIAYEPPELIGGDISVSTSKPEIVGAVVDICEKYGVKALVGAGVKNSKDFTKSMELGAKGVLLASGIVKSNDPSASLTSLINSQSPD